MRDVDLDSHGSPDERGLNRGFIPTRRNQESSEHR
jgi:hypothetical protein